MVHIFTDEELRKIVDEYVDKEHHLGGAADEYAVAKYIRNLIEEKLLESSDWLTEKEDVYYVDFYR